MKSPVTSLMTLLSLILAAGLPCRASNLNVANYSINTIEVFTPGGVGSVFANTGLSSPTFITFTPEPSTWAMFAIGVVALLLTKWLKILRQSIEYIYVLSGDTKFSRVKQLLK